MVDFKCKIILAFGLVLVMVLAFPVFALDYNPSVSLGQYVKYGNFVYTGVTAQETKLDWTRTEVTAVSGKEVTLSNSGQFVTGTAIPGSGSISTYNIETGKLNGTMDYTYGVIIAGNLNEGDAVPPLSYGFVVNRTETRTYLGVSREVNIIETTYDDPNYANHWTLVYDKISGIMLESEIEYTQKSTTPTTTTTSYSVTETNIFGGSTSTSSGTIPVVFLYVAVVAIIVIVIVAVGILMLKRRAK
jgi:hypothetical protein